MEVINSVVTIALINYTTTVTTRFGAHMSVFLGFFFFFLCFEMTQTELQRDAWLCLLSPWICLTLKTKVQSVNLL